MKILFDARMVTGHHGIGRYALNLIQGLIARKHEVSILAKFPETQKIIGEGLDQIIYCQLPFAHPAEAIELASKIHFSKYEIVHLPSFAVPFKTSRNMVVTIHDLIHLHRPSLAHKIYYNTILKRALNGAGGVITVSDWAKKELHQYLKIDLKKISVVRNGLESKWFAQLIVRENPKKPFFLCLSNTKEHKNVRTLIKAAQNLWQQNLDFNLVLSLGGQDLPTDWNFDSSFNSRITVLKNVSDDELQTYFQNSLGLISPSYLEGYDYGVAEALAQGKPAILSQGSAHDEFKGEMAYFYGAADDSQKLAATIKKVFDAPPLVSLKHNISTQSQMVEETLSVYRNCVP